MVSRFLINGLLHGFLGILCVNVVVHCQVVKLPHHMLLYVLHSEAHPRRLRNWITLLLGFKLCLLAVEEAHFSHLHYFDLSILLNELFDVHEAATNSDEQSTIDHFGDNLLRTEHVLVCSKTLNFEWKVWLINKLSKLLINIIISYGLIDFDLVFLATFVKL